MNRFHKNNQVTVGKINCIFKNNGAFNLGIDSADIAIGGQPIGHKLAVSVFKEDGNHQARSAYQAIEVDYFKVGDVVEVTTKFNKWQPKGNRIGLVLKAMKHYKPSIDEEKQMVTES